MNAWTRIRLTWPLAGRPYEERKWLLITGDNITFSRRSVTAWYAPDELDRLNAHLKECRKQVSVRAKLCGGGKYAEITRESKPVAERPGATV